MVTHTHTSAAATAYALEVVSRVCDVSCRVARSSQGMHAAIRACQGTYTPHPLIKTRHPLPLCIHGQMVGRWRGSRGSGTTPSEAMVWYLSPMQSRHQLSQGCQTQCPLSWRHIWRSVEERGGVAEGVGKGHGAFFAKSSTVAPTSKHLLERDEQQHRVIGDSALHQQRVQLGVAHDCSE